MSPNKKQKEAAAREEKDWERLDNAVFKSENFLARNSKQLLIALAVVVVIAFGYLAYKQFYAKPRNQEAQVALFKGEVYFMQRQDSLALNGDGNGYIGFEAIIDQYGSTPAGNLAKARAGICYASMGNYEKALPYLKDYSGDDAIFSQLVNGTIGDCLDNLGKADEAVSYYEKAAKGVDDAAYSPVLYKKAALIYLKQGKYDKVIDIFTLVKNNYMNSQIGAMEAEKYIEEATLLKASQR